MEEKISQAKTDDRQQEGFVSAPPFLHDALTLLQGFITSYDGVPNREAVREQGFADVLADAFEPFVELCIDSSLALNETSREIYLLNCLFESEVNSMTGVLLAVLTCEKESFISSVLH